MENTSYKADGMKEKRENITMVGNMDEDDTGNKDG